MSVQVHRGAYGVLTSAAGDELLLIKKARGPYTGLLDLPGGKIEPGESPEVAVVREFLDETGLHIRVVARLGDLDHTVSYRPAQGTNEVRLHHTGVIFQVALVEPGQTPKLCSDGQDSLGARWVRVESLEKRAVSPSVFRALALWAREREVLSP